MDESSGSLTPDASRFYWRTTRGPIIFTIILIAMLFAIPGGLLFAFDSQGDPFKELERRAKASASQTRDKSGIHLRLEELGRSTERDYQDFRIRQFGFCAASAAIVMVLLLISNHSLFTALLLASLITTFLLVIVDRELTAQVKKRRQIIEAEFPAVIEMLTLAIAAGESPMSAMLRIADSADGELSKEFATVINAVRTGEPLHTSLDAMGRRVKSVMIRRFIDAIVTATLRGTPLIETLSRHAIEARANQRNIVMNAAGKAEISMMIPVVFLILPISILFALWPSLTNLNFFAS
ncbi:MAG: type II secretion system F family protein [Candidatus Planktophila sp.]|nr:type II secretion system F family protein [Candidatus Planktophila sp.]